jgi:hypothetical protein
MFSRDFLFCLVGQFLVQNGVCLDTDGKKRRLTRPAPVEFKAVGFVFHMAVPVNASAGSNRPIAGHCNLEKVDGLPIDENNLSITDERFCPRAKVSSALRKQTIGNLSCEI